MINKWSPPPGLDVSCASTCIRGEKTRGHWTSGSITRFGTIHAHVLIKTRLFTILLFGHFLPVFYSLKKTSPASWPGRLFNISPYSSQPWDKTYLAGEPLAYASNTTYSNPAICIQYYPHGLYIKLLLPLNARKKPIQQMNLCTYINRKLYPG